MPVHLLLTVMKIIFNKSKRLRKKKQTQLSQKLIVTDQVRMDDNNIRNSRKVGQVDDVTLKRSANHRGAWTEAELILVIISINVVIR